jgi:ferredoxin-NADP reductase
MNAIAAILPCPLPGTTWASDRWSTLVCRAAWDETPDVRTFLLAPAAGGAIAFEAGQFLTLRAIIGGETVERCYTIASSAAVVASVQITVKRKPGGALSGHLHDTLRPGGTVEAFGPAGAFGVPCDPAPWLLLLAAAGSGVTPMAAILRTAADHGEDLDAVFVHAARTADDVIFADELARLSRRLPRLGVVLAVSRCGPGWPGLRGRIDAAALRACVPDLAARTVLCCGPVGFMATVREAAMAAGVPPSRCLEESFDVTAGPAPAVPAPVAAAPVAATVAAPVRRITLARSGRTFDCAPGQTILQAARAAGVPMPASCTRGLCGTCKCRKTEGSVTMVHAGGIRQREIDAGMILPCSSRPETDLTLDR